MKIKSILMTILLAVGFIAAKAAPGYPPELVLVSQPVLTYNDYSNTITVYYDVQNIGDSRYKGYVYIYLDPDDGYYYAREWVKVCPGRIKRIAIDIPAYRPNPSYTYTIMPYYELGNELYSFTTFEYFEPLSFHWYGPRTERWVVYEIGPRPRYYVRPGDYRYYYDGFRPMLPPPVAGYGPGPGPRPPMDPHHHTYNYHHNNGGYPGANYYYDDHGNATPIEHNNQATVRPHDNGTPGSMSSNGAGVNNQNNFNGSGSDGATTRPNSGNSNVNSGSSNRPSSGTTTRPNSGNSNVSSGSSNRPSSGSTTTRPNSGNSNVSSGSSSNRPSSGVSSGSNSGSNRPSSGSSNVGRSGNSSNSSSGTSTRSSSGSSSSNRSGNSSSSSSSRASSSSSSSSRSSGTSSSSSSSRSSNSSSSSSRSSSSSSGARR